MKQETVYYLIRGRLLGKREGDYDYYLYRNGSWEKDSSYLIFGKLGGYDSSEPEGSPYGWGSSSVMDEIEEISEEEALKYMNDTETEKTG